MNDLERTAREQALMDQRDDALNTVVVLRANAALAAAREGALYKTVEELRAALTAATAEQAKKETKKKA